MTEARSELRDYLKILQRRKLIVIVALAVTVGVAMVSVFVQTPVYESEARIVLSTSSATGQLFNNGNVSTGDPQRNAATEVEVLQSSPVEDAVKKSLGRSPHVSASVVTGTNVLSIRARSTNKADAAKIADAYAKAYLDLKRTKRVDELIAASAQVQNKITDIGRQISELEANAGGADITQQRNTLFEQQATFRQQLDELQVQTALGESGAALATPASVPHTPVEPRKARSLVLSTILGLLLGIAVALTVDHFDDSIESIDDLEDVIGGVPVIAQIPGFNEARTRSGSVVTLARQTSPAAESYRSLRTSVQFMGLDTPLRALQITSSNPFEGKTTTVANLGVAIATTGTRVAIVDLDLRRPRMHEVFQLDNEAGFTSVLLGRVSLDEALQPVPGMPVEGLAVVLPAGPVPPNPSELLSSPRVEKLLDEVKERVDIVLLDSPPVLPVTDALVVSRCADALILVARAGVARTHSVGRAIELLQQVGAPLRGMVLNNAGQREFYGYGYGGRYGYGYGYGEAPNASSQTANRSATKSGTRQPAGRKNP